MKILKVFNNLRQGGAERIGLDIARELSKLEGIQVKIILIKDEGNDYTELSRGLEIYFCPSKVVPSILGKHQVDIGLYEKFIDEYCPDIIHSYTYHSELVTHEVTRSGIKYITHFHYKYPVFHFQFSLSTIFLRNSIIALYNKKRLQHKYLINNSSFIAISTDNLKFYKKIVPNERLYFLPNAIDFQKFNRGNRGRQAVFKPKLSLISVGRFDKNKNQIFLLEVARLLKEKDIRFKLVLLGDGECKPELVKKAEKLKVKEYICFEGTVSNVEDYLHKSHIYLHPAFSEAAPIAPLEAMATGLPYISFDNKGNKDILRNGVNGFLVKERRPEAFLAPILELYNNIKLYEEVSRNAIEFSSEFDLRNCIQKLWSIYTEVLKE